MDENVDAQIHGREVVRGGVHGWVDRVLPGMARVRWEGVEEGAREQEWMPLEEARQLIVGTDPRTSDLPVGAVLRSLGWTMMVWLVPMLLLLLMRR